MACQTCARSRSTASPSPTAPGPRGSAARTPAAQPGRRRRRLDDGRRRLATGPGARRVCAPDLRGHGHSEWLGDAPGPTRTRRCDDARELIAALGVAPVDVVGHSTGGIVAHLPAQARPDVVGRLVVEDVPAPLPCDPPRPPTARPDGDLSSDWALVASTDAQVKAPDPARWERLDRITAAILAVRGARSHLPQGRVAALAERTPGAGWWPRTRAPRARVPSRGVRRRRGAVPGGGWAA
ncbi:alpha/beta fold hydrolase [Streptomyces sp. NPDC049687]|uniref:alpha/beta fold hydrolase n=1 Tax=Streptomyces sp. NPDC049687 TaxID=3365596 RepID=UPI0037BA0C07